MSEAKTVASDAPAAPAVPKSPSLTFKLSKPIQAHGNTLSELVLREPTPLDMIETGYPIAEVGENFRPDVKRMVDMISRLGDIPPSSVKSLVPKDLATIMFGISRFFVPDWDALAKAAT